MLVLKHALYSLYSSSIFLIVSLNNFHWVCLNCRCNTHACTVFFFGGLARSIMWVLPSQLQYTCTYIILFVELHIHNYHYLPIHLHHMNTYSVLARKAIHLSMSGGQTHHHPLGTVSDQVPLMYLMSMTVCVCICSIQIHCGCIGFSLHSQVGRWLILCAPAVCSWSTKRTKFQKCPAELSNN